MKNKKKKIIVVLATFFATIASIFGINTLINAEETPSHHKSIHDNEDGTYTLSLDVIGANEKKVNKAIRKGRKISFFQNICKARKK